MLRDKSAHEWNGEPVSHPLDGIRAKIVRASQQAVNLSDRCREYEGSHLVELVVRYEDDAHYVYVECDLPPAYLSVAFGEVIHDLRSALDRLAWQLAVRHLGVEEASKPAVGTRIYFPIRRNRAAFEKSAMPFFHPAIVKAMDAFQPYHNEGKALNNPLQILQEFSNDDKHRGLRMTFGVFHLNDLAYMSTVAVDDSMVEYLLPDKIGTHPSHPVMRIEADATAHIVFAPLHMKIGFESYAGGSLEMYSHERVHGLCLAVNEVVDYFALVFPPVDWSERTKSWFTPGLPELGVADLGTDTPPATRDG